MKILNCYIKGFGTYYNKEFTFHDGLNYLYELNGEGKTTLASFIKAMLYGLESYKDNSKDFKDRKHYKPFNNNSFGGSLTFISNNKTYKVERTFDAKSQEKDTIAIYVNDVLENFDKEIGEEILQLDKDAFERLMYITSSDIKIESNSNLKKHLNNIIDATDESFNYDDIFKNVNQHKNKYDRNKNSLIQDEKNNSSNLLKEIKENEQISSDLEEKYQKYNEFIKERNELSNKISQQGFYTSYQEKQKELNQNKDNLSEIINKYPNSYPNETELLSLLEASQKIKQLEEENSYKIDNLETINDRYSLGLPNVDETNTLKNLFTNKEQIKNNILINSYDEKKLVFYQTLPLNDEIINSLKEQYEQYKNSANIAPYEEEILNRYKNTSCLEDKKNIDELENKSSPQKINKLFVAILILLFCILVSGITLIFIYQIVGIILTILSLLGLVGLCFIYLTKKINNKYNSINPKTLSQINEILKPYGYNYDSLSSFKQDILIYQKVLNKNNNTNLDLEKKLIETIKKYKDFNSIDEGYNYIFSCWEDYKNLLAKKEKKDKFLNEECENNNGIKNILAKYHINDSFASYKELEYFIKDEQNQLDKIKIKREKNNIINSIYDKYNLGSKTIDEIQDDCQNIRMLKDSITKQDEDLKKYQNEHNIDTSLENIDFNESLEELNKKIEEFRSQIVIDENQVSSLPSLKQKYNISQQNIERYKHNVVILEYIASYLSKAQTNLDQKYVQPIKDTFVKYLKILDNISNFSITINREFAAQLNVQGETKTSEYLSSGQLFMCTLCLRLALADNIYKSEIPFLIMDDPFVYLDANNLLLVNNLLREVLNGKQVIYLTCHESRKIII